MINFKYPVVAKNVLKWLGWIAFGCLVLYISMVVIFLRLNTVTGSSTVIAYKFTPNDASFQPVFDLINRVAEQNGLKRNGAQTIVGARAASWSTQDRWLDKKTQKITFYLDASPHDELDARNLKGHISIGTEEADQGDEWQLAAKTLETELAKLVRFDSAHVQLDSRVYGLCASEDRPDRLDTTCFYTLEVPIDFGKLNSEILLPRAANMRPK